MPPALKSIDPEIERYSFLFQAPRPRRHQQLGGSLLLRRDRVAGFGEQLVNALYPAPAERSESDAPEPGPRLYFPPDRADFQRLKDKFERDWIPEMCRVLGIASSHLPVLWDANFLLGTKNGDGADTYVLCEINASSVYPFSASALAPLVRETLTRVGRTYRG